MPFSAWSSLCVGLRSHRDADLVGEARFELGAGVTRTVEAFACVWRIEARGAGAGGERKIELRLRLLAGEAPAVSFGPYWSLPAWTTDVFTLLPGAVYSGNRYECRPQGYSPRYPEADARADAETLVTDIPRLAKEPGVPSRIQLLTGDLAAPAFAARWPDGRTLLVTAPDAPADALWELAENAARDEAWFALMSPGVREKRYSFRAGLIRTDAPSPDRGRVLAVGEELTLRLRIEEMRTPDVAAVFERLLDRTDEILVKAKIRHELPLSAAAQLVEAKRNREDWAPGIGVYRTTNLADGQRFNVFQTGWCGGIIAESALLVGCEVGSAERAASALDTICARAPRASGWLAGKAHADGSWTVDFATDAARPWTRRWTLVRRQADALTYLLAAADRHEATGRGPAPAGWLGAARGLADAFARIWETRGAPGHFIDIDEPATVMVGGSASGAVAAAGLVAAWRRFGEERHLRAAAGLAGFYHDHFTARGVTTGGPADAMQAPDSESAAGLVDSFVALHEAGDGAGEWLERARAAAAQLASWVMPYDYAYPSESEFGRLGMPSAGSVFANAQNKHSAPGLCTHSGLSLLRLYRHTGDARYLRLVAAIARFLPWVVSRADRPIHAPDGRALPAGWMNERVNTSDWDHNLGGVFYGSTWSEVSLLLTAVELPSVYSQTDTGVLVVLDHVEAEWMDAERSALRLRNPTRFAARVRLLVETSAEARARRIGPGSAAAWPVVEIAAGDEAVWVVKRP